MCAAALASLVLTAPATATDPHEPFAYGAQQLGLSVAGGFGLPIFGDQPDDLDNLRTFGVFPRWSIGVTDRLARGALYEGALAFGVEPMVIVNFRPRSGWAAGGTLILHYDFVDTIRPGALVPFIEGGGGAGHLDFSVEGQSDDFVFPLQASIGVQALSFEHGALTGSIGYYHLSNAGTNLPNYGINLVTLRIGVSWFAPLF